MLDEVVLTGETAWLNRFTAVFKVVATANENGSQIATHGDWLLLRTYVLKSLVKSIYIDHAISVQTWCCKNFGSPGNNLQSRVAVLRWKMKSIQCSWAR